MTWGLISRAFQGWVVNAEPKGNQRVSESMNDCNAETLNGGLEVSNQKSVISGPRSVRGARNADWGTNLAERGGFLEAWFARELARQGERQ